MFVGGNGAGKSTILASIRLFLDMMFQEKEINLRQFICLMNSYPEFKIEYTFHIMEEELTYILCYNEVNMMIKEYLYENKVEILKREGNTAITHLGEREMTYNEEFIKSDGLFLRTLHFNGSLAYNTVLKSRIKFLNNSKSINASADPIRFLGSANIDEYFTTYGTERINNFMERYGIGQQISFSKHEESKNATWDLDENLVFYHRTGMDIPIPCVLESLGNRNLVRILVDYLKVIEDGGMLVIDEFSSGFHNELESLLIRHFMREAKNAQLFFVSHSTNLVSNAILRPDQIYTVDYVNGEGSRVNRISSFQPRNSQNIEKMYNSGVFYGKPIYEDKRDEI